MRVLQLVDALRVGGAERLLPIVAAALRERGCDVQLAALADVPRSLVADRLESTGFSPHVIGRRGIRASTIVSLRALYDELRPDVVHMHIEDAAITGVIAASAARIPSVVTLHNTGIVDWTRPKLAARELLFRLVVGLCADRVVAVSSPVARYYARRGIPARKLVVIRNAIDPRAFAAVPSAQQRESLRANLGLEDGAPTLISVGMLRPAKGHANLLKALPSVLARHPRTVLLLAGDGPERGALEGLARDLDIAGSIRFLGVRDDIPQLLRIADVFVFPSLDREGLPTALIEAGAVGLPSVASDIPTIRELITHGENGLLTRPADSAALATSIGELLDSSQQRDRMADAARARVHDVDPLVWADRLIQLYDGLSTSRRPQGPRATGAYRQCV